MRSVSYFDYKGRKVHVFEYAWIRRCEDHDTLYRVSLDGEELPVSWPNARELEYAIRRLLDEQESTKV